MPEERVGLDAIQTSSGSPVCLPGPGPAWQAAAAAGIDMQLIEESLRLSPWQRLEENQRALRLTLALEAAGKRLRERPAGDS